MKKILKTMAYILLIILMVLFFISAVVSLISIVDCYYPATVILPTIFFTLSGLFCLVLARNLKNAQVRMQMLLIGAVVLALLGILIRPVNQSILDSWERYAKLTYIGGIGESTYSIENLTNHTLQDVVVVITCEGFDADGETVYWDVAYETQRDIKPNNTIVVTISDYHLKNEYYKLWDTDVKFLSFKRK